MNYPDAGLIENEIFQQFRGEIEALGFSLSTAPSPGSTPYAVITGRSNTRWWLVPLESGRLASSGLALFQPVVPGAKILKYGAVLANSLGLSSLWARKVLYISGKSYLADIFSDNDLRYAFFTGTDSPHRKSAIQIMDRNGVLKGFAKVTRNRAIKALLHHEAGMLNHLQTLELRTALLPRIIYCGGLGSADVLATDTLKTSRTKTTTMLNRSHVDFVRELTEKTSLPDTEGNDRFVTELRNHYTAVADTLPTEWQQRLEKALAVLADQNKNLGPGCLCHGDFTPWNTFFVDGKLYVFDWEYAQLRSSPGYDLIHFLLSLPAARGQQITDTVKQVKSALREMKFSASDSSENVLILAYLCCHSLRYIGREPREKTVAKWDGNHEAALLIDALLGPIA